MQQKRRATVAQLGRTGWQPSVGQSVICGRQLAVPQRGLRQKVLQLLLPPLVVGLWAEGAVAQPAAQRALQQCSLTLRSLGLRAGKQQLGSRRCLGLGSRRVERARNRGSHS